MDQAWEANLKRMPSFLNSKKKVVMDHDYGKETFEDQDFPIDTANRLLGQCKALGTLRSYNSVVKKLQDWATATVREINLLIIKTMKLVA